MWSNLMFTSKKDIAAAIEKAHEDDEEDEDTEV